MSRISGRRRLGAAAMLLASAGLAGAARAESLSDALGDAYQSNATILAERFRQRQTDEQLPEARAGWKPSVTVQAGISRMHQFFGFGLPGENAVQNLTPQTNTLTIAQPLYHGGAIEAGVDRAEADIAAGQATLRSVEQQQLLAAATAYLDVYRGRGVVDLSENLVKVLTLNRHDIDVTYKAGAATETDLAQAEARLEGAKAESLAAKSQLETSLARFRAAVGRDAGTLDAPAVLGPVPAAEDEAARLALDRNPDVAAARQSREAARHGIDVAFAALLPSVDGTIVLEHAEDDLLKGVRLNAVQAGVQATVPLYQGQTYARIRAAKEAAAAADKQVLAAERAVREQVSAAWNALQAAQAQQTEFRSQIKANEVALDDTVKEVTVGTRTRLDVLNAQQELFSSRVSLVGAERDTMLATYQIQAATGGFVPSALGLAMPDYDPAKHLDQVRGAWLGTAPPEQ
jgi:outer membrane protein